MNTQEALKLVGGLSKPSKMPGWAYGIPAAECKTGGKLNLYQAAPAKDAMRTKVAMFSRLYKQLNTED